MPRPTKCRRIQGTPRCDYFKPRGIPLQKLNEVRLSLDRFEAIRLADLEGLPMEEASARMNVSRHTFGRILSDGRRTVAEALVKGHALRIEGGHYEFAPGPGRGMGHGRGMGRGQGLGMGQGQGPTTDPGPIPHKEASMNKVAVTSEGPTLSDKVDPRFGRAAGFVVVDLDTMEFQYVDNGSSQAMAHGAGIQAARVVADAGAAVVLTGFVGPKAFPALQAAGITVVQDLGGMTVREAVDKYKSGQTTTATGPNK